jgi:two-component system OmpR family response regulator
MEHKMVNILIIEDDDSVRLLTKARLKDRYKVLEAGNGLEALEILDHQAVDLIICDIMMPEMDGYEFLEELRESGDQTPVILLTAMDTMAHKKKGFQLGTDDYVTKPVDYEELILRIEAILRRSGIQRAKEITIGDFILSEKSKSARIGDKEIQLTEKEFDLLYKLLSYPDTFFTKQQLMDEIWGFDSESDYDTIKTYVNRLRRKFQDYPVFQIVSLRGVGYKAVIVSDKKFGE